MLYKTESDSVLFDTKDMNGAPFRLKLKATSEAGNTIDDALAMMHVGDSACFKVDAETFFIHSKGIEAPAYIKKGSKLTFYVRLSEIFSMEEYQNRQSKGIASSLEEEERALKTYLEMADITQLPTKSGMYYIERKTGTGKKPGEDSYVTIHYTGTFINGQIFDSSYKRGESFRFRLGEDEVIEGLEEGILYMKEGGSATLIIPSTLGYGDKQFSMIPPFSTLVFEIELLKIE
jgi:FKBP-type peptidyl-prolyl cis-trans isomerase